MRKLCGIQGKHIHRDYIKLYYNINEKLCLKIFIKVMYI